MASELIHEFSAPVEDEDGAVYTARIRGMREHSTGQWQGWIEFLPRDGGEMLRTERETTQSKHDHLVYWATGLTVPYLTMALKRAHKPGEGRESAPPPLTVDFAERPGEEIGRMIVVETLDPTLPRRIMMAQDLPEGRVRRIPGGGILVYEGADATEGRATRHRFRVVAGSRNAAAVTANSLWSALHGEGARLEIEGVEIPLENHRILEALVPPG